jgi:hypothetical protein
MTMDFYDLAQRFKVVDVWAAGNETGWITPRVLYDPAVRVNGESMVPVAKPPSRWLEHGTVGVNTLKFWGTAGSIQNGTYTLAHYLVPHEQTEYRDGKLHDTTMTVFKMVPPGFACNHAGLCAGGINNANAIGVEYENLQNGKEQFSMQQYAKGALVYCHDAAFNGIKDAFRTSHGLVAVAIEGGQLVWGRRSDPFAGPFDYELSWAMIRAIRSDSRIWQFWGLAQPKVVAI